MHYRRTICTIAAQYVLSPHNIYYLGTIGQSIVKFSVDKVALRQVFLLLLRFSLVIRSLIRTHYFIHHRCYTIISISSVVK